MHYLHEGKKIIKRLKCIFKTDSGNYSYLLFFMQIRKIVFIQTCIRRWLARIRIKRGMWHVANQVVSAKKAAKAWMTRKAEGQQRLKLGATNKS